MASTQRCLAQLSRSALASSTRTRPQLAALRPAALVLQQQQPAAAVVVREQVRYAQHSGHKQSFRKKDQPPKKKKKGSNYFKKPNLKQAQQFALLDAMRYIRAFEVGRPPSVPKYELHVKLHTLKNGPVIRNRLRLPHPVKTDLRICVIAAPDSKAAEAARSAGAVLVGEDDVFEAIKAGRINFERCICHVDSSAKMNKAGLGRILGPKGLMPSAKTGTVLKDVASAVKDMVGGAEYRERLGVIRIAIGQLGFTPEEIQRNIKAFVDSLKKDMAVLSDRINKEIHEVVLSSTNSPGFSLNGEFSSSESVPSKDLATQ